MPKLKYPESVLLNDISVHDDQKAFKKLFDIFYKNLCFFANIWLKSEEDSHEIVLDIFLELWLKRKKLNSIKNIKTYLYIATKNRAFSRYKLLKKNQSFSYDEITLSLEEYYFNPENILIDKQQTKQLNKAIEQLPPRCKLIFKMIREDGLKYKEASEILGVSVNTIDNQIAIAIKKLSQQLNLKKSNSKILFVLMFPKNPS